MSHILIKTEELGPKSFDTQLFIITDKQQDFLLSFNGFLDKKNGNLAATFEHMRLLCTPKVGHQK